MSLQPRDMHRQPRPKRPQRNAGTTGSGDARGDAEAARAFLVRAAEQLHRYGMSAHRLEATLVACARGLGLHLQVFATPTSIELAFGARRQTAHMIRADAGDAELARLVALDAVIEAVARGDQTPRAGRRALRRIVATKPPFGAAATTLAFGLSSAGAARFLGGNLADVLLSLGLGLAIATLAQVSVGRPSLARVFAPLAAFVAAFVSSMFAELWVGSHTHVTTLAALIVLLPGLSLTLALSELATRHLVSGTARLAGSLTVLATMAFGVALAQAALAQLGGGVPAQLGPLWVAQLPAWSKAVALVLAPLGFCVLFQARRADILAIVVASVLAASACGWISAGMGPEAGAFAGALVVGLLANAYAGWRRVPAAVLLLPGLLLLVPGSLGFQSVSFFIVDDGLAGIGAAFRMVLIAASLVAGLLAANAIVPPWAPQDPHRLV